MELQPDLLPSQVDLFRAFNRLSRKRAMNMGLGSAIYMPLSDEGIINHYRIYSSHYPLEKFAQLLDTLDQHWLALNNKNSGKAVSDSSSRN